MKHESWGIGIFVLGIIVMFLYTAFSFLWAMSGTLTPYPLSLEGASELVGAFAFFAPPIGALLMVAGGFIYVKKEVE